MFENQFNYSYANELNMYYCGKRIQTPHHSYGPEIRTHFLIVLIREGHATLFHRNGNIRMGTGNLLVMFPNERIHYKVDEDSLWTIQWVGVYGNVVNDFLGILGITPESPVFDVANVEAVGNIMEKIYQKSFGEALGDKVKCISLLYDFFSALMDKKVIINDVNYVEEAKRLIDYNFDKNLKVDEIADKLHLSASYFSRLFKDSEGVSPKTYILNKKIERACQLLKNGNCSVGDVAYSVGLYDQLYFSRLFKEKVGVTPSEYMGKHLL